MNQRKIAERLVGLSLMLAASTANAQMSIDHSPSTRQFQRIEQPFAVKAEAAIAGVSLIGLELWWFLFSKPKTQGHKEDQEQADLRD